MKYILFLSFNLIIGNLVFAQSCDNIYVNLKKGTVNKVKLTASMKAIKDALPCSTGETPEGSDYNCGGGIFFLDHDFYFYSDRDYFEARKNFKGTLSVPVIGLTKAEAIASLKMGEPLRAEIHSNNEYLFFKTKYGCLWLKVYNDKVVQVDMSAKSVADTKLCL